MTTVYLHVGMPKCASSALQSLLHKNDALHRTEGLCYPVTYRETGGYFSHRPLHQLQEDEVSAAVELIATEAAERKCDRVLISSEEFVNSLWDRKITGAVINSLNARFGVENVRILMLFRNPFNFVESVYAQYLRGGMFRTPDGAFMKSIDNKISGFASNFRQRNGFDFFSFRDFIERIRSHAPDNSFVLLSTERKDWDGQDILDILCQRMGITRGRVAVASNDRYSETALLLLHYARLTYGFSRVKTRREIISNLFPPEERKFSTTLHVSSGLFENLVESIEYDKDYFYKNTKEPFETLLSVPEIYKAQLGQVDDLIVPEWCLRLTDRVITADQISFAQAAKMKVNMQRRFESE